MTVKPILKKDLLTAKQAAQLEKENKEKLKEEFVKQLKESIPEKTKMLFIEELDYSTPPKFRFRLSFGRGREDLVQGKTNMGEFPDWDNLISERIKKNEINNKREKEERQIKKELEEELKAMLPSHLSLSRYDVVTGMFVVVFLGGSSKGIWKHGDPVPDWDNLEPFVNTVMHRSKLPAQMENAVGWARGD